MKNRCGIISLLIIVMVMLYSCKQTVQESTPEDFGLLSDSLEMAALKMKEFVDQGTYPFIATMVTVDG